MAFLGQVVFLSSVILLLRRHAETKNVSALIYPEEEKFDSILHRLELNSSCIKCLFDCGSSCLSDKPLRFSLAEIGPVDFLYEESKIFFLNKGSRRIESIHYAATSATSRVTEHELCSKSVYGIAVDWIGRNLYYTDVTKKAIVVTSLRVSASRLLVHKNLLRPYGVAVDASRGNVCWTDLEKLIVECLQLLDMNRTTVYSHHLVEPTGITIDFNTGNVYWTNGEGSEIYRATTDGSDIKTVYTAFMHKFYGLTFLEDIIFAISRPPFSSKKIINIYEIGSDMSYGRSYSLKEKGSSVKDLTFYDERRQSQTGKCSDISACRDGMCVMTGLNTSRCLCPAGKKPLGGSCVESNDFPSLSFVYSVGNAICFDHVLQVENSFTSNTSGCFERSSVNISALCVHESSKTVYLYRNGTSTIRKRSLDKHSATTEEIRSSGDVTDMAVDQNTGTLYWTLMNQNLIRVWKDGVYMTWKYPINRPYAITVHSGKRKVFWSTLSARPSLNSALLDGDGARQILSGGIRHPSQLAFDGDERLYWTENQESSVNSVRLDGTDKKRHNYLWGKGAFGIALWQGYLAWTETGPTSIVWAENDNNFKSTGRHAYTDGTSAGPISFFTDTDEIPGPCQQPGNGACEQFCFARSSTMRVCRCGTGFTLQSDGISCTLIECPELASLTNGYWDCPSGTRYNSTCTAKCSEGHQLQGDVTATCGNDGLWISYNTSCMVTECLELASLKNGFWDCPNGTKYNSTCKAKCSEGHYLQGDATARCGNDGIWISYDTSCTMIECPGLASLTNGYWDCFNGTRYNSTCKAKCSEGHQLHGDPTATCGIDGIWISYTSCKAQIKLHTILGVSIAGIVAMVFALIGVSVFRSRRQKLCRPRTGVAKEDTDIFPEDMRVENPWNIDMGPLVKEGQAFTLQSLQRENWAYKDVANWGACDVIDPTTPHITIAMVDSGVQMNHPYLREWEPHFVQHISCVGDNRSEAARNDHYGHGTFIAGILCHMLSRVRQYVHIINIKALNDFGELHPDCFWKAMEKLSHFRNIDVVCLAVGFEKTPGETLVKRNMLADLSNRMAMIAAASNYGVPDPDSIAWPARRLIAVGSHDKHFRCSSFSPQGQQLDVLAPGEDLCSLNASFNINIRSDYIRRDSGTSFAAAYVTGVAAHFILQVASRVPGNVGIRRQMTSTDMMKAVLRHMARDSQHTTREGYGPLRPLSAFEDEDAFRNLVKQALKRY